jgi:SAM-dependent methyltransferase
VSASICRRRGSLARKPRTFSWSAIWQNVLADEVARGAQYDLALAADVFVYVNDLAPVFAEVARVLRPGGILAFTVETHANETKTMAAPASNCYRPSASPTAKSICGKRPRPAG